ncbi:MAG TPA: oxidative damage protection protein [Kofleriaceae bacterium]
MPARVACRPDSAKTRGQVDHRLSALHGIATDCRPARNLVESIAMTRMVKCTKLGETLPGLPYKPFNDALGQRIYDSVSAQAWSMWIEHSKKIVNEYRLDLTQKKAHEVLKEQCEAFLFGDGGLVPPEYVPEKH